MHNVQTYVYRIFQERSMLTVSSQNSADCNTVWPSALWQEPHGRIAQHRVIFSWPDDVWRCLRSLDYAIEICYVYWRAMGFEVIELVRLFLNMWLLDYPELPSCTAVANKAAIRQIQEILPDFGDGFLAACLEAFNGDQESVIQHLLEGNLPGMYPLFNLPNVSWYWIHVHNPGTW